MMRLSDVRRVGPHLFTTGVCECPRVPAKATRYLISPTSIRDADLCPLPDKRLCKTDPVPPEPWHKDLRLSGAITKSKNIIRPRQQFRGRLAEGTAHNQTLKSQR